MISSDLLHRLQYTGFPEHLEQIAAFPEELRYRVEMESRALLSSLRYRQQGTLVSLSLCKARSVSGVQTRAKYIHHALVTGHRLLWQGRLKVLFHGAWSIIVW